MEYWARKEVADVIGSRNGFDAGRVIKIAAKAITPRNGGPMVASRYAARPVCNGSVLLTL